MILSEILLVIWLHFLADFVCQTREMAKLKSTSFKWLSYHVSIYSSFFVGFGWKYALFNGVAHFITDAVTSRMTSMLWKQERHHEFFMVIGADQAIHMTCLIGSLLWLR